MTLIGIMTSLAGGEGRGSIGGSFKGIAVHMASSELLSCNLLSTVAVDEI
jgi:hypothetical protein